MKTFEVKIALIFLTLTVLFGFRPVFGQGSEERIIGSFDEIKVTGNFDVELVKGTETGVQIRSSDVEPHKVVTELKQKTLKIRTRDVTRKHKKVTVVVTYTELRAISVNAGAFITSDDVITGDKIELIGNTGGMLTLHVDAKAVEVSASEGARLELSGNTESVVAKVSTGAIIEGFDLKSQDAYAKATTGGIVKVVAHHLIDASASLGGEVFYKGHPESESTSTSLGGVVNHKH